MHCVGGLAVWGETKADQVVVPNSSLLILAMLYIRELSWSCINIFKDGLFDLVAENSDIEFGSLALL